METVSHIQGQAMLGELASAGACGRSCTGPGGVAGESGNVAVARLARFLATFRGTPDRLGAFLLSNGGRTGGLVPYVLQSYPLPCRIGDVRLFNAPLRRMRLLHEAGYWPDSPTACQALLSEIAETVRTGSANGHGASVVDVVCATGVPVDSGLARALTTGGVPRQFRVYSPTPPVRHQRILLPDSFEAYLAGLSPKSRATLRRKVRKLLGEPASAGTSGGRTVQAASSDTRSNGIVRVTNQKDVPWLVARMSQISRKTYQYNLLGLGVRDAEQLVHDATVAAQRGWLRSYVLVLGGRAVAFMHGMQFPGPVSYNPGGGTYDYIDVGHDPDFSAQSPGTVLQYLVIQDLCGHNRPAVFDFGPGDAVHKERFANESYLETDFYLFRSTSRAVWARSAHAACTRASAWVATALDRVGLKSRVRRTVRRLASA